MCYSDIKSDLNCSRCEKCYRTIIGIILANDDPNKYGFTVNENIYQQMFDRFLVTRNKIHLCFWLELKEKAKTTHSYYVFNNREIEGNYLKQIADGEVERLLNKGFEKKIKSNLRDKFPLIYRNYIKIRYQK